MRTITKRIFFGIFLAAVGGFLFVGAAYAHAAYLRSVPGADSVIAASPPRVEIWFKQEVFRRKGENVIRVTGADGKPVSVGDTTVDDNDRTHILVSLQANLPPGTYTVNWKNTSLEDGHSAEDNFVFTLDPQAKVTSTPMGKIPATAQLQPTETETAPAQASPTNPAKPTPVNGPCAASLVPIVGLTGFVLLRRHRLQR